MKRYWRLTAIVLALLCGALSAFGADWDSAKSLYPGIKLMRIKKNQPRLIRMFVMRIDLQTPGLTFAVTGRAPDWDKPMPDYPKLKIRTKRTTTGDFLTNARKPVSAGGLGLNMLVAFNATPWRPWEPPYTHKYADPPGVNISDGVIVGNRKGNNPTFVVYRDGRVDIVDKVDPKDFPKIKDALSGFQIVARNGKAIEDKSKFGKGLAPRTAYGLSADRRYLYIIAIDGRQPKWSLGASCSETGQFLVDVGASDVINMDGGGSTTMCYWDRRKKKPVMVNRQSPTGTYMRPVAMNLGIVIKK